MYGGGTRRYGGAGRSSHSRKVVLGDPDFKNLVGCWYE